ncbi:hypothetical protein H4696_003405 [Amycolatopsis lexingtonensis]|uniref:Uncharacterized protein n=1 Tax=Amycolatopsis lexingtonensis TaxID=218822 RepID=A0ABR9HZE3_9PSEU|nr:hypothetical protein [Amycolatopsis lexingtonensis]MBE1496305.1 hypothetical protein [Amycolatopsis lexingtonensis]
MVITMRSVGDATMTVKKPPDDHTTAKLFTGTTLCHIVRNIPTFDGSAITTCTTPALAGTALPSAVVAAGRAAATDHP